MTFTFCMNLFSIKMENRNQFVKMENRELFSQIIRPIPIQSRPIQMQQTGNQGMERLLLSVESESDSVVTLLVKHLPDAITEDALLRILSHYDAVSVRPCSTGRLRNCAFVDFKNEALAYRAQHQLNGLRFLGKVLAVERAGKSNRYNMDMQSEAELQKYAQSTSSAKDGSGTRDLDEASVKHLAAKPIAPRLGIDYPFPPHLEYAYPPPDSNILTNIVNALIAVPRFYTQVLHLMNKMNIPAPFRMALPTPPLPSSATELPPPPPPLLAAEPRPQALSSDESEMESSDEGGTDRKRIRREAIVGPGVDKNAAHEVVGVKSAKLVPKEIPVIRKKNPVLQIKIAPKVSHNVNKDTEVMKEEGESGKEGLDLKSCITPEELESGKLPSEQILSLPLFKKQNYSAGNPTSVLYIKNLAKDVVVDDLYFLFGLLFGSIDAAKSGLIVRLMQEGRMRGQAFITFPSVVLAQRALTLVHGYVLKGKPVIIQFGKNPSTTSAT